MALGLARWDRLACHFASTNRELVSSELVGSPKTLASRAEATPQDEEPPPLGKKRSFFQLLRRPGSERTNGAVNGTSGQKMGGGRMPTDKSTEPLVASANWHDESARGSLVAATRSSAGLRNATVDVQASNSPSPVRRQSSRPTRLPISLSLISQQTEDDDTSQASEMITPSIPTRLGVAQEMRQAVGIFNENLRLSRQLAQKEYEWLATILERCCFIIFVIMFLFLSLGINYIGFLHWSNPEAAFGNYRDRDNGN